MKILITGAGGFLGAYFVSELQKQHEIIAVGQRKFEDYWRFKLINKDFTYKEIDLANKEAVFSLLEETKPDFIIHFASYGTHPRFQKDENKIIETNVFGAKNVIDAALKYNVNLINIGSSSEYGDVDSPMKEDGPVAPTTSYGVAKLFATNYCQVKAKDGLTCITVRPFSVFGLFEEPSKFVPLLLTSAMLKNKAKVSNPNFKRDFLYIKDFFTGVNLILNDFDKLESGSIFNISSGKESKLSDVVEIISSFSNLRVEWDSLQQSQPELKNWFADITKIKLLGWQPEYGLDAALKETYKWISNNIIHYKEAVE